MPETYHWLHIPSGKRGERTTQEHNWANVTLFALLNKWNAMAPGQYQYWQDATQRRADYLRAGGFQP